jgi:hypothetical protein
MKKLLIGLGIIVIAGALVGVGWWLGFGDRALVESFAITSVDQQLTDASENEAIIQEINSGQIDQAKDFLKTRLDGNILVVDSLIGYAGDHNKETAYKLFTRIAKERANYPSTNHLDQTEVEVSAMVDSILKKAQAAQK